MELSENLSRSAEGGTPDEVRKNEPEPDYGVAFTVTVNRNKFMFLYEKTIKRQYEQVQQYINLYLQPVGPFECNPELTLNNDIHFHGRICVKNKVAYHKFVGRMKQYVGFSLFKAIDNVKKWEDYIRKDNKTMSQILGVALPYICT